MSKFRIVSLLVLFMSVFAVSEVYAQNVTFEVRNCTDDSFCVTSAPYNPILPGCAADFEVCAGTAILGPNSTTTKTIDTYCRFLTVSRQSGGSGGITSNDPSGPIDTDLCACWDYSGANPVLTIYEGACNPPCPAPACP